MGNYCPAGSSAPLLCGPGTYLNTSGNNDVSDCIDCTAGWYCPGTGDGLPTGLCTAGWYCPGGQDNPTPVGLECTQGSSDNTVEPLLKDHPIDHKNVVCHDRGCLWWQVQLYWNVGPSAKRVVSQDRWSDDSGLSRQVSLYIRNTGTWGCSGHNWGDGS